MPASVGLRVYRVQAGIFSGTRDARRRDFMAQETMLDYLSQFLNRQKTQLANNTIERSIAIDSINIDNSGRIWGILKYGTFGTANDIEDPKTRKIVYRTKHTDNIIYPLYYQFYFPRGEHFGFFATQSVGLRSCAGFFQRTIRQNFSEKYSGYRITFEGLSPESRTKTFAADSQIQRIQLLKARPAGDVSYDYVRQGSASVIDMKVEWNAGRGNSILPWNRLPRKDGKLDRSLLIYNNTEYDELKATVKSGNKIRTVTLLGPSRRAGLISLNEHIEFGPDGNPVLDSIHSEACQIVNEMLQDIRDALS